MSSAVPLQYWDSCVFIEFLAREDEQRVNEIRELIRDAQAGRVRVIVSQLLRAEIVPFAANDQAHSDIIDDFLLSARGVVRFVDVTRSIAEDARRLVADRTAERLTVPDAIHLATALQYEVDVFFTYDGVKDRLRNRSRGLLGLDETLGSPLLKIRVPRADWGPLFEGLQAPS